MSTDTLTWFAREDIDSPWRRLHWTLPLALLICSIAFIWFAYLMEHPAIHTPEPVPVNAELVELPTSAQPEPPSQQLKLPSSIQHEQPSENPAQIEPTQPPAAPAATSPAANNPTALIQNRSAQTIVQPLPVIPDELREEAMNEAATVRFHIAEDGSATVDLIKPTQNPRLNRLLLDSLKHWKFNPAMKDGKPVASEEVMIVRVQVK